MLNANIEQTLNRTIVRVNFCLLYCFRLREILYYDVNWRVKRIFLLFVNAYGRHVTEVNNIKKAETRDFQLINNTINLKLINLSYQQL